MPFARGRAPSIKDVGHPITQRPSISDCVLRVLSFSSNSSETAPPDAGPVASARDAAKKAGAERGAAIVAARGKVAAALRRRVAANIAARAPGACTTKRLMIDCNGIQNPFVMDDEKLISIG
eukprot:2954329-Pleurochrysis_carterae.AAC.2